MLSLVTVSQVITAFHSCCLSHHVFDQVEWRRNNIKKNLPRWQKVCNNKKKFNSQLKKPHLKMIAIKDNHAWLLQKLLDPLIISYFRAPQAPSNELTRGKQVLPRWKALCLVKEFYTFPTNISPKVNEFKLTYYYIKAYDEIAYVDSTPPEAAKCFCISRDHWKWQNE